MAIEGELARAGIVTTDDATVFVKPVSITGDINVEGPVTLRGATSIDGDLTVLGNIVGEVVGKYQLQISLPDLTDVGAGRGYAVIPTGGDGYISRALSIIQAAAGSAGWDCILELNTETGALVTTYDITIADNSIAGTVDSTVAIPSSAANNIVAEGEAIWIDIEDGTANAIGAMVVVEITRT